MSFFADALQVNKYLTWKIHKTLWIRPLNRLTRSYRVMCLYSLPRQFWRTYILKCLSSCDTSHLHYLLILSVGKIRFAVAIFVGLETHLDIIYYRLDSRAGKGSDKF